MHSQHRTNQSVMMRFLVLIIVMAVFSCKGKSPSPMTDQDLARAQKELINDNKRQHNAEMLAIKNFISEKQWPMQETPTGLHYWIYEPGKGNQAKKDDRVAVSYTISLLDGTKCYESDAANPKEIHIGHGNIESGLHEALQLMHEGDKAKFILPSHLAFGFTGDSQKIPQNASVLYEIQLLRIQP
jgi:FKBP-type peptidyl-prolyl cis-trans isomerase FkpA